MKNQKVSILGFGSDSLDGIIVIRSQFRDIHILFGQVPQAVVYENNNK